MVIAAFFSSLSVQIHTYDPTHEDLFWLLLRTFLREPGTHASHQTILFADFAGHFYARPVQSAHINNARSRADFSAARPFLSQNCCHEVSET